MIKSADAPQGARPTPGYLYTLSAALLGIPCIATALGGALIGRSGGDPIDVLDGYTVVAFLFMFALAFAMRLIFWPPAPSALRRAVRALLAASFGISIALAPVGLLMSLSPQQATKHGFVPVVFSVFALLCQIGSILWLAKYSRDGL